MENEESTREQLFHAGVQCVIFDRKRILLGRRYRTMDEDTWSFPGGHIQFSESAIMAARRELKEETCLDGKSATVQSGFFTYSTTIPYVHFPVIFLEVNGNPRVVQGEKFSEIKYFPLDELPQPLFLPTRIIIESLFCTKENEDRMMSAIVSDFKFFRLDFISIQPEENRDRGYIITLVEGPSETRVLRSWGKRTWESWRNETSSHENLNQAVLEIESIVNKRLQHGYLLAGAIGDISLHWLSSLFPADAEIKIQAGALTKKIALEEAFRKAYIQAEYDPQLSLFDFRGND